MRQKLKVNPIAPAAAQIAATEVVVPTLERNPLVALGLLLVAPLARMFRRSRNENKTSLRQMKLESFSYSRVSPKDRGARTGPSMVLHGRSVVLNGQPMDVNGRSMDIQGQPLDAIGQSRGRASQRHPGRLGRKEVRHVQA